MNNVTITPQADDAYNKIICRYLTTQLHKVVNVSKTDVLEILTEVLVGTKERRLGGIPNPESLVTIRETIRAAIDKSIPIPVLIPFGGKKTNSNCTIDIAEVNAIWQLVSLDEEVKKYYPYGLGINIRIEDTGAMWLYPTADGRSIEKYSNDFAKLVKLIKGDTLINPIKESTLMKTTDYFSLSKYYSNLILDYLIMQESLGDRDEATVKAFTTLLNRGWKGTIPSEQKEYYVSRYMSLYDNISRGQALKMLADYLGGSKARYELNGRAEPKTDIDSHIQITFVPPIPGAPTSIFNNTLYHRIIPLSQARTHIAAWRAKGYLKINRNEVKSKITSWKDTDTISQLVSNSFELKNAAGDCSVILQADYVTCS